MRVHLRQTRAIAAFALAILPITTVLCGQSPQRNTFRSNRIKNFGCINENFYRGAQPSDRDYAELAAAGIKTIVDLQQDGSAGEQRLVETAGMKFYRVGLSDKDWPSPDQAERFLKVVNDPDNQPVFVHCHGGKHRAGIMTAIYRMTHDGWTADKAYAEMKQYGFESGFGHGGLRDYVYDYYARVGNKDVTVGVQAEKVGNKQ